MITLDLFLGLTSAGAGPGPVTTPPLWSSPATNTRRIGQRLHLAVVTVTLPVNQPLQPGTLYSYNVVLRVLGGTVQDLKTEGILRDVVTGPPDGRPHLALGYAPDQLPSFALPPAALTDLRIVHGSCRKLHGEGPDSMAIVDRLISGTRENPDERPHQMFLTGDQIYADEVPAAMSAVLTDVGIELLTGDMTIHTEHVQLAAGLTPVTQATFPAGERQAVVTTEAKFTTGSGSSHLLSFGEYAAMYLLSWANGLWPVNVPGDEADEEARRVREFQAAVPAVRRALANVPTYMILDDHEVTDDLYLSDQWRQLVLTSPLGRDVVRNGLTAYGLFQGWGNDPEAFNANNSRGAAFLHDAELLFPAGAQRPPERNAASRLEDTLGMTAVPVGTPDPRVSWHYTVLGNSHVVHVLDTRTRRSYADPFASPSLLSRDALQAQIPGNPPALGEPAPFAGPGNARPGGVEVAFVVSAAPVLGVPALEALVQQGVVRVLQMKATMSGKGFGPGYKYDPEPWAYDPLAMEALLRRLAPLERIVFLSGDVHFAASAAMSYWDAKRVESRFAQFTSSAFKKREGLKDVDFYSQPATQALFGRLGYPVARNGWLSRNPLPVQAAGATVPYPYRTALDREPVVLNVFGWPPGTVSTPPDWMWQMEMVVDQRPDDGSPDARPLAVQPEVLVSDVVATDPSDALPRVARRHAMAMRLQTHRRTVFTSNVGVIRLQGAAPALEVREDLFSYLPDPDDVDRIHPDFPLADAYTRHVISLAPTGAIPPQLPL